MCVGSMGKENSIVLYCGTEGGCIVFIDAD